jgi:hypothetical protein
MKSPPRLTYRVPLDRRVQVQRRDAPRQLQYFVASIVAFPQTSTSARATFPVIIWDAFRTIVLADDCGFLGYEASGTANSSSSTS